MDSYRQSSKKGKIYFYSYVLFFLSIALFMKYQDSLFPITGSDIEQLKEKDFRLLLTVIVNAVLFISLLSIFTYIAISTQKHKVYPPPNIELPFKQKVKPIKHVFYIWLIYSIFFVSYISKIVFGFYIWYDMHQLIVKVSSYGA